MLLIQRTLPGPACISERLSWAAARAHPSLPSGAGTPALPKPTAPGVGGGERGGDGACGWARGAKAQGQPLRGRSHMDLDECAIEGRQVLYIRLQYFSGTKRGRRGREGDALSFLLHHPAISVCLQSPAAGGSWAASGPPAITLPGGGHKWVPGGGRWKLCNKYTH